MRWLFAALFALAPSLALGQGCGPTNPNCAVPLRPPGDSTNFAASTAWINQNLNSILAAGAGTWTPTFTGTTGAGTPTYSTQQGSYDVVGRSVILRFYVASTSLTGVTGNMSIGGVPFPNGSDRGSCFMQEWAGITLSAGNTVLTGQLIGAGTTTIGFTQSGSGISSTYVPVGNFAPASYAIGICSYHK